MAVRCLVSVPALHAKRTYTLEEGTLDALKAAISTCPIMGDRVDLSKSTFKARVQTRHFYNKVMIQLQEKYPQLQDAIGSGMDSWRCSLRMKFKNQRRSLSNDARVAENRKKFSASRNTDDICTSELKWHKKRKMNIDISGLAGEDENSFEKHEEWLRSQAFSAAPDENGSPACSECPADETIEHVLLQCPGNADQRRRLFDAYGRVGLSHVSLDHLRFPRAHRITLLRAFEALVNFFHDADLFTRL
ncbi:hypothetical protein MRX96_040782 [Rhipicephalus microplus]